MTDRIVPQAWEDVADDVTGAIEKAVQPLLKRAINDIYGGLLDATQDYLKENLAFNIASRISAAERDASDARQRSEDARRFAEKWMRFAKATTAPVSLFPALDELGDEHELTITVDQFREFCIAAESALQGPQS